MPTLPHWSQVVRFGGLLIGTIAMVAWLITGTPPQTGLMTFAAGCVMIPNLVEAQRRRNGKGSR